MILEEDIKKSVHLKANSKSFPPEEIDKYISRLPLDWLRKLTPEQKQIIIQKGINELSAVEVRALKGINATQKAGRLRSLTSEQKQIIIQKGIDDLSAVQVRVLGGLSLFQEKNEAVQIGIQETPAKTK